MQSAATPRILTLFFVLLKLKKLLDFLYCDQSYMNLWLLNSLWCLTKILSIYVQHYRQRKILLFGVVLILESFFLARFFWRAPFGELLLESSFWRAPFGEFLLKSSFWRAPFGELLLESSFWRAPFGELFLQSSFRRPHFGDLFYKELTFSKKKSIKLYLEKLSSPIAVTTVKQCCL